MTLRIILDCTPLRPPIKGVANYIYNLVDRISCHSQANDTQFFIITFDRQSLPSSVILKYQLICLPPIPEILFGTIVYPVINLLLQPSLCIKFSETASINLFAPTLTICHDLNERIYNFSPHSNILRHLYEKLLQRLRISAIKSSRFLVANSLYTAGLVSSTYCIAKSRFSLLNCAVDDDFFLDCYSYPEALRHCKGTPYILSIYTGDAREQIQILPNLLFQLHSSGYTPILVIVGPTESDNLSSLEKSFTARGFTHQVHYIIIPFIPRTDRLKLAALYYHSEFYVELSIHEGFGMQLIEALATGTKCVALCCDVFLETSCDYPLYVQNLTADEIATCILSNTLSLPHNERKDKQRTYIRNKYSWNLVSATFHHLIQSSL